MRRQSNLAYFVLLALFLAPLTTRVSVAEYKRAPGTSRSSSEETKKGTKERESQESPEVKKSKTGICHAKGSTFYSQTRIFVPFGTLDECLESGGRLPKR